VNWEGGAVHWLVAKVGGRWRSLKKKKKEGKMLVSRV
jgi:hypothetical protein